jgi:hypothetical protein
MLQAVREPFGSFGRFGGPACCDLSSDPAELTLDPGLNPVRRAPDQRIQPADRQVKPVDIRDRVAASPVLVERDHLSHDVTLALRSDTVRRFGDLVAG